MPKIKILSNIKNKLTSIFKKSSFEDSNWIDILSPGSRDTTSGSGGLKYYRSYSYACINARAENTAKAKIYLYKKLPKGKLKAIDDHPFLDLISKNNIHNLSFFELLYSIVVQLDLYGNAYVYSPKNLLGTPGSLIVLNDPSKVKIERGYDFNLKYIVGSGANEIIYSGDEIIHFKFPYPGSNLYGKSTISALSDILKAEIFQSQYQTSFYKNDAHPGAILEYDEEMSQVDYDKFLNRWNAKFKGPENSNKVTILEGGMKMSRVRNTPREIDFINSRKEIRDEIFSIFRVPKVVLAITDQVNYANAYAGLTSFVLNTVIPLSKFVESKLDSFVKSNYDPALTVKLEYDTFENEEVKLKQYEMLIKTGTITKNELRQMIGLGISEE
ncbi:hypothetical protein BH10BAC5_BH10BAC5_06000 [soil metagenome]